MKLRLFFTILLLLCCAALLQAQTEYGTGTIPLSEAEKASISELQLLPELTTITLPGSVFNDQRVYFPPIYNQGLVSCCAQAAAIGHAFTYEINRLRNVAA